MATYNPTAAKKLLTDAGFTYKGSKLIDPKGNPVTLRHPRDLGLVGLGRLAPDHHQEPAGDRHRLDTSSSSRTGTPGTRTRRARRTRRCSGRARRRARRTASSTRTCHQNAYIPSGQDGDDDRQLGALPEPERDRAARTSGRSRSTRRSSSSSRRSSRSSGSSSCRSSRCSSGRAGRPTARSTSTASRRRRTTTAIRSSPRSPTTSCRSPASAPAARPAP